MHNSRGAREASYILQEANSSRKITVNSSHILVNIEWDGCVHILSQIFENVLHSSGWCDLHNTIQNFPIAQACYKFKLTE